jgi:crotonobetainyl-CoA:carnitine CoA-transferase CaiB-like acyl-CoA transferase
LTGILDGVRVLDLTRFLAGPHCTLLLAGMGAEVIRVDDPNTGDSLSGAPYFYGAHGPSLERRDDTDLGIAFLKRQRSKKSINLDLKTDAGRSLLLRLIEMSDVIVENFSVGVTQRLGIDWPVLQATNPRLVHCSITGYGSTGPDRERRGFDLTTQATSGLMSITGEPGGPPQKAGSPLADTMAASFAFSGILGALYHRETTGLGQFVDVSMVDVLFSLVFDDPLDCFEELGVTQRNGNRVPRLCPFNTYRTTDGWMVICCGNDDMWHRLCEVIDSAELATDTRWGDVSWRIANHEEVDRLVGKWTADRNTEAALEILLDAGVPSSAVHTINDLLDWSHLHERGMIDTVIHPVIGPLEGLRAPGFPIKFSGAETGYDKAATLTGSDTRAVLAELLGMEPPELDDLETRSII